MARNCLTILKEAAPDLHDYLRQKTGVDFDLKTGKGRQEYLNAAKELQNETLSNINNVLAELKIPGYEKIKVNPKDVSGRSGQKVGEPISGRSGEEKEITESRRQAISPVVIQPSTTTPQTTQTRRGVSVVSDQTPVQRMVNKIASGESLSSTEEEFYNDNATEIESELKRKFQEENEQESEISDDVQERTRLSDALFAFADKISGVDITGAGGTAAMTNFFKIPQEILATAIRAVATALKGGELFSDAIQKGIKIIRDADHQVDEGDFTGMVNSVLAGGKPKMGSITAKSISPDPAIPSDREFTNASQQYEPRDPIASYHMTRGDDLPKAFGADLRQQEVFDSLPSEEKFRTQMGMLQDGKSLIAAAQSMFGTTDINIYGRQLFRYIQNMSDQDVGLTNKKAVLLATLLGEIKQALHTNENTGELQQLDRVVGAFYNKFMHVTAKNLAAGRLLRLFRDKYMADMFLDKILEEQEMRDRNSMTKDESEVEISDEAAETHQNKPKDKPDTKAAKDRRAKKEKEAKNKKAAPKSEYERRANEKENDIKNKYGSKDALINTIIDKIKKLNCK